MDPGCSGRGATGKARATSGEFDGGQRGDPAPLWLRFFALSIDGMLLAVIGYVIGYAFFDSLIGLGQWGRLVGIAIALPYFALLNSWVGSGQTLSEVGGIAGCRGSLGGRV